MASSTRTVIVELRANIDSFRRGMDEGSELARRQAGAMDKLGKGAIVMGGAMAAGFFVSAKAAIEWTSAWAGVSKTVNGSAEQMAILEEELRGLATTLPTTHTEIAAVAEAAGQLGVKREDITSFVKTMVDLGQTTDLSADQAATGMARLANIMGTTGPEIDNLGSALVALGNDGASTESEIVDMAVRIAGAGKQIGLTEGEVLGFANALSSVGIEAEAGGSSISRVMIDIATAVEGGGKDLATFAEVAGVTTAEFSAAFGQDAAGAVNLFIDGLGQMTASGQSTFGVLDELGMSEIRVRDALLRLSNAQGLATASTALGNQAWKDNTALVEEANKRYETTEAKIQVAKNSLNELAIDLGTVLLPAIGSAAGGFADLAGFLSGLPEPMQAVLVVVGALGAALALTGGAALVMLPKILALQATLVGLGVNAWTASIAVGALGAVLKTAGLVAAALALAAGVYLVAKSLHTAAPEVAAMTEQFRGFIDSGTLTGEVGRQLGQNFEKLAGSIEMANRSKWDTWDGDLVNGSIQTARDLLISLDETLAGLVTSGKQQEAAAMFAEMAQAVETQGGSVEALNGELTGYYDALAAANRAQKDTTEGAYEAAGAIGGLQVPLGTAYDSLQSYAEAQGYSAEKTEELTKQVKEWGETLAGFVEPLGAYTDLIAAKTEAEQADAEKSAQAQNDSVDAKEKAIRRECDIRLDAMKSNKGVSDEAIRNVEDQRDRELSALDGQKKGWEDYADQVTVSVGEYLAELTKQVEAQQNWAGNMTMLAARVSVETLEELARMGPEGAPLVAQLVNASDAEMAKLETLFRSRTATSVEGVAEQLRLANPKLREIAGVLGQDVADSLAEQLAAGTITVAQIARDYADVLAGGINPILTSLGKTRIAGRDGSQGGVTERADGGPVWGAGTATSDSIPALLSNGEYVIRASSVSKYGQQMLEQLNEGRFARGGLARFAAGGGFTVPGDVPRPSSTAPYGPPISTAGDGTMGLGYQSVADFLRANAPTAPGEAPIAGGPVGGGPVGGNLVAIGRSLQQMGFRVSEHPAFGGVRGRHAPRSYHASGRAIDVNYGPGGQNAIETRAINAVLPTLAGRFVEKLWQVRGHYDHLHLAMAKGGLLNPHVRDAGGPLLPGYHIPITEKDHR